MRIASILALLPILLIASCSTPPPEAFVSRGGGRLASARSVPLGQNAVGEPCTQQVQSGGDALIYCGTWTQPSAHVVPEAGQNSPSLMLVATTSPWRKSLDVRFNCAAPQPATMLGGEQAIEMQCTRKAGGWPHIAMVVAIAGKTYLADGVQPARPAIQRSIAILSGRQGAEVAEAGGNQELTARRMAAQSFTTGDIDQYQRLMRAGRDANYAGNAAAAEAAYRAAAALQQKALGPDNPALAMPLLKQAFQISAQGRFAEAQALFGRAARLASLPNVQDEMIRPTLLHYRAVDLINQNKDEKAFDLLNQAEFAYSALVNGDVLAPSSAGSVQGGARGGAAALAKNIDIAANMSDPVKTAALLGVISTRRDRAIALRKLGRAEESGVAANSALALANSSGLSAPIVMARLYRTDAMAMANEEGREGASESQLRRSSSDFARALPGSRAFAETSLVRAGTLVRQKRTAAALGVCQQASRVLNDLKAGTDIELMAPCLDAYATEAGRSPQTRQAILAEMFEAAQIAQGSITSQQIAQASARLSESARDSRVSAAIRQLQDAVKSLADLEDRQRLQREGARPQNAEEDAAGLEKRLTEARAAKDEAESVLQAASPNYGQLVQQVVKATEVFAVLRPGEAFAATVLSQSSGWTFLLQNNTISVSRIDQGMAGITDLVRRMRASLDAPSGADRPAFDSKAAQALYTAIFGGIDTEMAGTTRLSIAPVGPLLSIPFAALLTGPAEPSSLSQAPWLVRRMAVSHVPAAANFVSLRKLDRSRASQPWFGFGEFRPVTPRQAEQSFPSNACGDSARLLANIPLLPGAKAELDAARQLLGAPAKDQLLNAAFTAETVLKQSLKDYRILHFATHALLPTDLPCLTEPAIVTSAPVGAPSAGGALLTASAVLGMDLDADTVILSACNTGGPSGGAAGESLSGLARSFFYAGARSLLVTHWSVNDRFNAYLVALTLDRVRAFPDRGLADALAEAQRRILNEATGSREAEADPFFWAPVTLIGDGGGANFTKVAL